VLSVNGIVKPAFINKRHPSFKGQRSEKIGVNTRQTRFEAGGLHAFRHGRVSVLQENGVPGDLVKEWIGHSSLRTTSRYTHLRPEFRERVATEVGLFKPMLDPIGPNPVEGKVA
jgi:integrase